MWVLVGGWVEIVYECVFVGYDGGLLGDGCVVDGVCDCV